jgi:hypothetical protein
MSSGFEPIGSAILARRLGHQRNGAQERATLIDARAVIKIEQPAHGELLMDKIPRIG